MPWSQKHFLFLKKKIAACPMSMTRIMVGRASVMVMNATATVHAMPAILAKIV